MQTNLEEQPDCFGNYTEPMRGRNCKQCERAGDCIADLVNGQDEMWMDYSGYHDPRD